MNRKGGMLLPVLIVLIIFSFVLAVGVFYLYQTNQKSDAQNVKLLGQITELESRQRLTVSQLEESKKLATDLGLKLQEATSKMDSLTSELAAEKTAHIETSNKLEQFKTDLAKQKSLREDLENRFNLVQNEGKQIKEQIKIMNEQKVALEEKIKNLETGAGGVELGTVVVSPELTPKANAVAQSQTKSKALPKVTDEKIITPESKDTKVIKKGQLPPAQSLEGKVMIVNKEFNFVVINLGSKDKVNVGDEFVVSRVGKSLGDLKIEKVHEFMSAAGFAPELKDLIKENDKVTQKIK